MRGYLGMTVRQSARNNSTSNSINVTVSPAPRTSSSMGFDYSAACSPSTSSRNNNAVNRKRKHEVSQEPTENNNHVLPNPNSPSRPNSSASGEVNSDTRSELNGGDDCLIVNEVNGKPSKFNDDLLCEHGENPDAIFPLISLSLPIQTRVFNIVFLTQFFQTTPRQVTIQFVTHYLSYNLGSKLPESRLEKSVQCQEQEFKSGRVRFILYKYGNLTFAVKRVWLHKKEWEILKSNYTEYFEAIPCTTPECSECVENYNSARTEQATCQSMLEAIQNEILKTMRSIEKRRNWQTQELGLIYTRVLCPKFVQKICKPSRTKSNIEIPKICQECLLCEHNSPYMILDEQESEKSAAGFPITYQEWNDLLRVYAKHSPSHPPPVEIKLSSDGAYDTFCPICNIQHMEEENNKRFYYPEGGDIYIKLQGDGSEEQETKAPLASVTTRRLAAKNFLKFKMTSCSRVIDLKLKVYEQIKQSPADQLIYLSDTALEDSQTLESARVEANNLDNPLILIVQQRMETLSGEPRQLEKGFRDTALSI